MFFCADGAAVNMGGKKRCGCKAQGGGWTPAFHPRGTQAGAGNAGCHQGTARAEKATGGATYLYMQYHYSPKALRELRLLAEAMEDKALKPTNLKGARLLPYIHKAIQVVVVLFQSFM